MSGCETVCKGQGVVMFVSDNTANHYISILGWTKYLTSTSDKQTMALSVRPMVRFVRHRTDVVSLSRTV